MSHLADFLVPHSSAFPPERHMYVVNNSAAWRKLALVVFAQHGVPIQLELVLHVILKAGNLELGRVSG